MQGIRSRRVTCRVSPQGNGDVKGLMVQTMQYCLLGFGGAVECEDPAIAALWSPEEPLWTLIEEHPLPPRVVIGLSRRGDTGAESATIF